MNNFEEYLDIVNSSLEEKREFSNGIIILSILVAFLLGVVMGTSSAEKRVAKILGKANGSKKCCKKKHKKNKGSKKKDCCSL